MIGVTTLTEMTTSTHGHHGRQSEPDGDDPTPFGHTPR